MDVPERPAAEAVAPAVEPTRNPLKRLYRWILSWAHRPYGTWALAVFAFLDSSVFPIPPLFLQVALSMERPRRSWWYAAVNTGCSVAGATVGWLIGRFLHDSVGQWLISTWGWEEAFRTASERLQGNAFWMLLVYSFLPLPYKVATISSGVFHEQVPLWLLLVASTLGRSARFFALAAVCAAWGREAKGFIDRRFNLVVFLAGGVAVAAILLWKVLSS